MKVTASVLTTLVAYFGLASIAAATTIAEINGPAFISPYRNQTIHNIKGLVTATGPLGFYIQDIASPSAKITRRTTSQGSNAIYVASDTAVSAGDIINIGNAVVTEYRETDDHIFLTQLTNAVGIVGQSSGNVYAATVLGASAVQPPNLQYTVLDNGDAYRGPDATSLICTRNSTLNTKYGIDFWESMIGQYVSISKPIALGLNTPTGDVWVRGDWAVTGLNGAGGLTYSNGDANPEAILIGLPLDSSAHESVKVGDVLDNVKGVVTYSAGHYRILPEVAISIFGARTTQEGYSPMASSGDCAGLTVGQYNANNLGAYSAHMVKIAEHIAIFMQSPDLVLIQEIMDNDGIGNTGAINSASTTLQVLRDAISSISGVYYHYTDISPMDGQDGGVAGGNIRNVYFYNPLVLQLAQATMGAGDAISPVDVAAGPVLTINPGRIDPTNPAFINSPKPIVAEFIVKNTLKHLFAVNVHSTPKDGSGLLTGDAHPPVNGGADSRLAQSNVIVDFVKKILTIDSSARVIVAGDFNENAGVDSMDAYKSILTDADDVFGTPIVERYTHRTHASMDKYDHTLLSSSLKTTVGNFRHFHVNTWTSLPTSPHDPSVLQLSVC